ncbi:sulfotransferase, putative [Ixodes scapularis]|uniref:Sulfotransferase, putative n=1 Tax=Ixodes scapularis TaxID=6945 RepID=B7QMG9_IXOSC|nr:sulfotransferase, putative [Ixodes scapularis]|eukprot:XP_002416374.1 sulfotransferase, putative [Ixodes scapularis]
MSASATSPPAYRRVEGLLLGYFFSRDSVRSALTYEPQPGDIFVAGYPKSGTTWTQYILWSIFSGGVPPKSIAEFEQKMPVLESAGAQGIANMYPDRPWAIKTHLPLSMLRYSERAKYVFIARNPYDCCVSYYHHTKAFPAYLYEDGCFDQFFDMFVEGQGEYGDYFDHLLPWYEHREDPNVLFLTYEGFKTDTEGWVLRMADFVGEEYGERLRPDPQALRLVISLSSVESMKKIFNRSLSTKHGNASKASSSAQGTSENYEELIRVALTKPMTGDFVRKGVVGDWRNHFSTEQLERMKRWIIRKTSESDVMQLWNDCDIPQL